ncbi:MAG: sigma-70 family RNA polymerase sigma factor [Actinomycetota bacterium]
MRRRAGDGQNGSIPEYDGSTATLVAELASGSVMARRRVATLVAGADRQALGPLLDALAGAAANGSSDALDVLLTAIDDHGLTGPALHRLVTDPSLAADIDQEVLVAVARSIHQFEGNCRFTTWLYSLTRNVAVSQLRRQRPTGPLASDDLLGHSDVRRMSSLVSERRDVHDAIAELPSPFRDAVILRDIRGLSYAEIAKRQGVTINTVRSRLSRGRALLANRVN